MPARTQARLAALAAATWGLFWIAGLPHYYRQYSFSTMAVFLIALVPPIALIAWNVIGRARPERRRQLGLWLSFHFTVPLILYDYLYCGLYLQQGWRFLLEYWYLTVYYVVPWLIFVPVAHVRSRAMPHSPTKENR